MAAVAVGSCALKGSRALLTPSIDAHVHVLPVVAILPHAPVPLAALQNTHPCHEMLMLFLQSTQTARQPCHLTMALALSCLSAFPPGFCIPGVKPSSFHCCGRLSAYKGSIGLDRLQLGHRRKAANALNHWQQMAGCRQFNKAPKAWTDCSCNTGGGGMTCSA